MPREKEATLYQTDGTITKIVLEGRQKLTYQKLKAFVGGTIQMVPLPNGKTLICNDNGKLEGLPKNEALTKIWMELFPLDEYPFNNDQLIVGDALIVTKNCV